MHNICKIRVQTLATTIKIEFKVNSKVKEERQMYFHTGSQFFLLHFKDLIN